MSADEIRDIVVLPGDGIGPEVIGEAVKCLAALSDHFELGLVFHIHAIGGAAIDQYGTPLPAETLDACRAADAILLGAVGGPQWDDAAKRPEQGLLKLRSELGLFANLRPVGVVEGMENLSPLRPELVRGADLLIVRELTGGIYFGEHLLSETQASDSCIYSAAEIERVARVAFEAAAKRSGRLTSVDKANVLATSKLWRSTVIRVAEDYPLVALDHMLVDAAAMALIRDPRRFDVILTENMFGDILSDEASVIAGSIGLLGSSSEGLAGPALFEPIHGSAPDLAGKNMANPVGAIASAVMLLGRGLSLPHCAERLASALARTLAGGARAADLGGAMSCSAFGDEVLRELERQFMSDRATRATFKTDRGIIG
jgi:3-isopropylmalate dehydrogenase